MRWTKYVFLIFLFVTLASYFPSMGAGFVYDFLGWQKQYNQGSFGDILTSFGSHGNHQFLHLVFYSFYKIFDTQGLPWYLFFCTLHAINGYLFYKLIQRLINHWGGKADSLLSALGAIAFLLHPYCVEPVVWKVCVHYLISCMEILGIFLCLLSFLESGKNQYILYGTLIYLVSLFTLELSMVTPLAVSFFGVIEYFIGSGLKKNRKGLLFFTGMLWGLLGFYLLLNKLTLGTIVGHYGEKVHLHFDLISVVSTELKYLVKHMFYGRYFSFTAKNFLFDKLLSYPELCFFGLTFLMAIFILHFIKIKRLSAEWHVAFFGLYASFLFILPVANMYFFHLQIGMNDRYSYLALLFLSISLMGALANGPSWFRYAGICIVMVVNLFFQQKTLSYWKQSTEVLSSLKKNFIWNDAPFVFILNSPDNMHGILMSSFIDDPSGIEKLIDFQTPHPFQGKMFDVFQYNMNSVNDGVKVEKTGPMQLKVTFSQWGNWWHRNGIGAGSYENEYYKADLLDYPYQVTFKKFPEGSVILYQEGKEWREFKM